MTRWISLIALAGAIAACNSEPQEAPPPAAPSAGVLAVSALHEYAGLPHHEGTGKHLWILFVVAAAIVVLGVWTLRRRHQARIGLRPGAGPT